MPSVADTELTFMGLDVHKDSISVGLLEPGVDQPIHDKIFHDGPSGSKDRVVEVGLRARAAVTG
ncbi:MAG: hypothetical protein ACNA8R_15645, partial [Nitriliruptoraceae bacterium]